MGFFDKYGEGYKASMNNALNSAAQKAMKMEMPHLPDGKYQAYIDSVSVAEPRTETGYPVFYIKFVILEGEYSGYAVFKRRELSPDDDAMAYLIHDFRTLNVDFAGLESLESEEFLTSMLDLVTEIQIKNKLSQNGKTYTNVYINRLNGKLDPQQPIPVDHNESPWG